MNNHLAIALLLTATLATGAATGYWFAVRGTDEATAQAAAERKPLFYRHPMNPEITSPVPAKDDMGMDYIPVYAEEPAQEREILFYRNPMNPEITSPVPMKDEMGMDYIPVYADGETGGGDPAGTVTIDPTVVQNIGVRTGKAERHTLSRHMRTIGRIDYDEERLARLYPKVEGWIEKLHVNKTGQAVRRGAVLLEIYSPQLVASQEEYLLAIENAAALKDSPFAEIRDGAARLAAAARERLKLLDVPEHELLELEHTRRARRTLHLHSPFKGIVTHIGVREGQYVMPQTELYRIADLSRVWVYVDVYEDDLAWVREGDAAEMRLAALPGRVFQGKVATIYPYLEAKTRTARVRLEFANPDLALKPEMYANVVLHASRQVDAVTVPAEAIVRSGARELVFVVRGPGRFAPREVKPGVSADGRTQILQGLEPGEEVVVSAQFLIDSESKLREAVAKMLDAGKPAAAPAEEKAAPPAHQH